MRAVMRGSRGLAFLILLSCQPVPPWLSEAPLIGMQVQDDAGRRIYLPKPPKRVALATLDALPLWQKAGLLNYVVAACYGGGENPRIFYLLCDDSLSLSEAAYKANIEWIWVSHENQTVGLPDNKVYVFRASTPERWLETLRLLGTIYGHSTLIGTADSLLREIQRLREKLQGVRRLRVAALLKDPAGAICTKLHPLALFIQSAGGHVPYHSPDRETAVVLPAETLQAEPPEVLLIPEGSPDLINDFLRLYPDAYGWPAIRYQRIFSLPALLIHEPQRDPVQTLYLLLRILHPEVVPPGE